MPTGIFYAAVGAEILCLAKTTFSKKKFQNLITTLLTIMRRQGLQNTQLKHLLNRLFSKHVENFL